LSSYHISEFVERREQLLQEILEGLDAHSGAALALIYMRNGQLKSPVTLQPSEAEAIERLNSNLGGCVAALESMKGSLVLCSLVSGEHVWEFKHPTIGDAYAATLVKSPEHVGIYIEGSTTERLLNQVTCGDVGIEKAVVLSNTFFPRMLTKLRDLSHSKAYKSAWLSEFGAKRELHGFLARRCSKDFLSLYVSQNPSILEQVARPGLFLSAVSEVRLAKRLQEVGLLPEEQRKEFVDTVSKYALGGEDVSALDDDEVRTLFTDDEFNDLVERIELELLPRLGDVRLNMQSHYCSSTSPEEHLQPLLDVFSTLRKYFQNDHHLVRLIDDEVQLASEWVEKTETPDSGRAPRALGRVEAQASPEGIRSIFDDVDASRDEEAD
ncbi:MAG TPA: hypothetical protein VFQ61_20005, partial [Polyangiaceae bacterium]|nr:hypothetical protein [Polyangiaceae bacterium]